MSAMAAARGLAARPHRGQVRSGSRMSNRGHLAMGHSRCACGRDPPRLSLRPAAMECLACAGPGWEIRDCRLPEPDGRIIAHGGNRAGCLRSSGLALSMRICRAPCSNMRSRLCSASTRHATLRSPPCMRQRMRHRMRRRMRHGICRMGRLGGGHASRGKGRHPGRRRRRGACGYQAAGRSAKNVTWFRPWVLAP